MTEGETIYWDKVNEELEKQGGESEEVYKDENGDTVACVLLGKVMDLYPSGKYYMPWCTNFTKEEAEADEEWSEKNREEADKFGIWMECGENDPTDLFAMKHIEATEKSLAEKMQEAVKAEIPGEMRSGSYSKLLAHYGHKVVIAYYGTKEAPDNVAVECGDCNEVVVDFDREVEDDEGGSP